MIHYQKVRLDCEPRSLLFPKRGREREVESCAFTIVVGVREAKIHFN